jgi:uncharacterized protein YbaR (Trm112 family)
MFIELAESLRCPVPHADTHLVLATGAMRGRAVAFGTLGCPACQAEYPIADGVVSFGPLPDVPAPAAALPDPAVIQALVGLESPGGYVVLVGSAGGLAGSLARLMTGVHFAVVNLVGASGVSPVRSLLVSPQIIPLAVVARGVVLGGEYANAHWLAEAARVTLRGQRVVVLSDTVERPPATLVPMAAGQGMWVGRKTA